MRLVTLLFCSASAWMSPSPSRTSKSTLFAIDYNDPVVAEEFANVQPLSFEDVEDELRQQGIPVSQAMNEMDVKLMLVEMRLRLSGKLKQEPKPRPTSFSTKFEEALWTKPAFKEYYDGLGDDHNARNVAAEYVNDPQLATQRYGKDYKSVLRKVMAALTAPPPVKTPTLAFAGFPANMGPDACRMTLESIGPVTDFHCETDELVLKGQVTFENLDDAKAAVAQYHGMDMGMGTALEMTSV